MINNKPQTDMKLNKLTVSALILLATMVAGAVLTSCEDKSGLNDYKEQKEQQW